MPRPRCPVPEWVEAHEHLLRYAVSSGGLQVRFEVVGVDEAFAEVYANHPAFNMDLFLLPHHGISASLTFGEDLCFDPEQEGMENMPPGWTDNWGFDMHDAPPHWFRQVRAATSVRIVASWRKLHSQTLVELVKPDNASDHWHDPWMKHASQEQVGLYVTVGELHALSAKFVIPSSVIPKVLGLSCPASPMPHSSTLRLSGALRRRCGWPENYVEGEDYQPGSHYGAGDFAAPKKSCITFTEELRRFGLVPVDLPFWNDSGVSQWWEQNAGTPSALQFVFQPNTALPWPCRDEWVGCSKECRDLCLGLWALDEFGYTDWEAPMIPLEPPSLPRASDAATRILEGRFRPIPCSVRTSEEPLAVFGPVLQNLVYVLPASKMFSLAVLPSNLRISFGERWREVGMRAYAGQLSNDAALPSDT